MAYELEDPAADPTYSIDFTLWLADADTINTHVWSVTPTGPTITDLGKSAGVVSARVAGVSYAQIYRLSCEVTTVASENIKRSIEIRGGHR